MIQQIENYLADLLLKWEDGHTSPLEVWAFAKALEAMAEATLKQEALKKAAHADALHYGKDGCTVGGFRITAAHSSNYDYEMPAELTAYLAEAKEAEKGYKDMAKRLSEKAGAEASIVVPSTGELVAVIPAIKRVTDTVKCTAINE